MSSLMQHDGETKGNRVVLKVYLIDGQDELGRDKDKELAACGKCKGNHAVLYKIARRPVGMLGCWVQFRINGEVTAPDLSVPIPLKKLPQGAVRMGDQEADAYWHSP